MGFSCRSIWKKRGDATLFTILIFSFFMSKQNRFISGVSQADSIFKLLRLYHTGITLLERNTLTFPTGGPNWHMIVEKRDCINRAATLQLAVYAHCLFPLYGLYHSKLLPCLTDCLKRCG